MRKNGSLFNNTRMLLAAGLALIFFICMFCTGYQGN